MEKGKRIEVIDGEIPLPESIIQHIQSFLNRKQAAQTSILSKSWRNAWSTSPNLDLDERNFPNPGQIADAFSEFANKAMQRYFESNLKIDKFSLCMKSTEGGINHLLANELISKALKMDVDDLNFEINPPIDTFIVPDEVLGAETLIGLSLIGCKIDRPIVGKVNCSRLKYLILRYVYISDDVVWDIISSCPLIENLLLSECKSVIDIELPTVSSRPLILALRNPPTVSICPLALRNPMKKSFEFHSLKSLSLDRLKIESLFTHDFCLKFHSLIELTLSRCYGCYGYKVIQISSPSLECISLEKMRIFKAKFDVPNMRKLKYSGSNFPILYFSTLSTVCSSEISIKCKSQHLGGSFFLKLKRFLTKLSPSKIYLSIVFPLEMKIYDVGDLQGSPRPVVENLMLSVHSSSSACCAVLDGLFWSCQPKMINQYWFPSSYVAEKANNELLELLLCRTLVQQTSQDSCVYFGPSDPREVNVEIFEETTKEWGPLPWKTLLDASTTSPEYIRKELSLSVPILGSSSRHSEPEPSGVQTVKRYTYKELKIATGDFSPTNKIGEGGFGSVFKDKLRNGQMAAIKVLSSVSGQGLREFLTEVQTISGIKHMNLVKLYGCCVEGNRRIIVYNYLENNSLAKSLIGGGRNSSNVRFRWETRINICIGVARGLAYLHEEVRPHIIHRDIKASNILLDRDLSPKISDFGLAKLMPPNSTHVTTRVAGTIGYLAPEYAIKGQVTRKSDVYSFGVLLIEIVSGRSNTNTRLHIDEHYILERVTAFEED